MLENYDILRYRKFKSKKMRGKATMKLPGYYSSGEFAKKAHITKKTVRYYDEHNILKPSM